MEKDIARSVGQASFAPPGLGYFGCTSTHGLRRGLQIFRRFAAAPVHQLNEIFKMNSR
jgi:hypothetical protein